LLEVPFSHELAVLHILLTFESNLLSQCHLMSRFLSHARFLVLQTPLECNVTSQALWKNDVLSQIHDVFPGLIVTHYSSLVSRQNSWSSPQHQDDDRAKVHLRHD